MRRVLTGFCLIVIALAVPTSAFAVNVSSNNGNGTQSASRWYSNGADLTGQLRSTSGNAVYYSGLVAISNATDPEVGRYSTNTSSTSYVTRGGTVSYFPIIWPSSFQGVKARVCRDINALPDTCGSWSSTIAP